ncbi:MAG: glycosyltransferase family 2 protein [Alphaproteobacteria bacterium]|nr:glycosyltransferase family 2 protein [Alphaproteobacteria bacterium]
MYHDRALAGITRTHGAPKTAPQHFVPASAPALDCAIIVPTYNEAGNVGLLAKALEAALEGWAYEIIFVDDWSLDGTPDVVAAMAQADPRIRLIRRFGRRGLSSAVLEGMLASVAPILAVIDADMQHDEKLLPALLDAIRGGGADVAIGSRYCAEGSVGNWGGTREAGSRWATQLAQLALKAPLTDPMSGFFAVRRDVMLSALPRMSNMGFKVLLDMVASLPAAPRVAELPYTFRNRHAGESKLDSTVVIDFLMLLIDKKLGGRVPPRMIMFGAIGVLGLGVHLSVLTLAMALGASFIVAQTGAVLSAIAFNFIHNNSLTYHDKRLRGPAMLRGLAIFYAVCGLGALANVGAGSVVFAHDHKAWLAGIAGAVVGSVWNFLISSLTVWKKK